MRSVGFVILNSSYASKCCHSKQFHEYFVCYNYRNDRIFFVATKQNVKDVLNKFIPQLVKVLPMEDAIFIARLDAVSLFSGNVKATIQSLNFPTSADKASYFLDNIIFPNVNNDNTNLNKLLTVMDEFDSEALKYLSAEIRTALLF